VFVFLIRETGSDYDSLNLIFFFPPRFFLSSPPLGFPVIARAGLSPLVFRFPPVDGDGSSPESLP